MNSYFQISFNTELTFLELLKDDVSMYRNRIITLFLIAGFIPGIVIWLDPNWSTEGIIAMIIPHVILLIGRFILYYFLFGFLLFWIGKQLSGNSTIDEVRLVLAYSMIPQIIVAPLIVLSEAVILYGPENSILLWSLHAIGMVLLLYSSKILIVGLNTIHKYGYTKALLNAIPVLMYLFYGILYDYINQ